MDEPSVLTSWKEIAHYLNCGVRTAQRWERELNLPVRRRRGQAVLAIPSELDTWVKTRATSNICLDVTAPTLQDAILQALKYLENKILEQPRMHVRLVLQLCESDVVTTVDPHSIAATRTKAEVTEC